MTTLYDTWKIKPSSKYLDGEDVDLYENYQLAPDVRPESIHRKGVTIRNMPNKDYERLKRFSSKRDGGRCKCCKRMLRGGGEGDWYVLDSDGVDVNRGEFFPIAKGFSFFQGI